MKWFHRNIGAANAALQQRQEVLKAIGVDAAIDVLDSVIDDLVRVDGSRWRPFDDPIVPCELGKPMTTAAIFVGWARMSECRADADQLSRPLALTPNSVHFRTQSSENGRFRSP